jgi:uncharacterized membrane protein YgcG
MKKIRTTLSISFLFLGLFFVFTSIAKAEVIRDFSSTINVLPDSSILVNENITYDFEKTIHHGILRVIPLLNSKNEPIEVKVISVTNEKDEPYQFTTDISDGILSIKIGDPNRLISGIKGYDISYQVFGSITYYDDYDEIYWNVTGNDWGVVIEKSEVKVILPNNVFPIQQACYFGELGSNTNCKITESGAFTTTAVLNKGEGLTVAVGFPKGVVSIYERKVESNFLKFIKTFWPVVIPIIVFAFMFLRWLEKGKDPRGTGVIIPQYNILDNLTPLEVGGIVNGKLKNQNISAEIIYLATKGYLKIKQVNEKVLGIITKNDYEFELLKEEGLLANIFDRKIITAIFSDCGKVCGVAELSGLKNSFYKSIPDIDNAVADTLLSKKYYTNFPKFNNKKNLLFGFFLAGSFFIMFSIGDFKKFLVFISSILISVIICFIFYRLMPAKSKKGVLAKEYLLGLKEYLQIAEKDRLNFHNAPDKKPEVFEQLLPFAMVFGVEELWAKEFKGIYKNSPEWYEGKSSRFNVIRFGHEMAMFSTLSSASISSSSSSSGSGGGGSSGGGGGGGGGGSW